MTTELVKIQSYISGSLANKLSKYKKVHSFGSISETIAAILTDFFKHSIEKSNEVCAQQSLKIRVEQLESMLVDLVGRIELLEYKNQFCESPDVTSDCSNNSLYFPVNLNTASLLDSQSISPGGENKEDNPATSITNSGEVDQTSPSVESAVSPFNDKLSSEAISDSPGENQVDISLRAVTAEMLKGISAITLVKRLNTSPATLRKYLRDSSQIKWAVERDPQQLGWIYEPLLQRYYPVQVNADGSTRALELNDLAIINACKIDLSDHHVKLKGK